TAIMRAMNCIIPQIRGGILMLHTPNGITPTSINLPGLDTLYKKSRSGLWGIFIYLVVTVIVLCNKDQSLAAVLPPHLMQRLGTVPPVFMAVALLWISTVSALTVIVGRLFHGTKPTDTKSQVGFRIGIYILFFVVGGLAQWFNELFISGFIVLALQHYNVSSYYTRVIDINLAVCNGTPQESL
ncbi:MAG: hypothetical protein OEL57_05530, partial [Trichlorobacter sp.]|uniref:hypothetical protein n=1 Tax=Trichlorobacter sp. TaxID=2911007 RepID=UPI002563D32D